jgi:cell division protein FtsW
MKRHLRTADLILAIATAAMLGVGVVMVLSASSFEAFRDYGDAFHFVKAQLLWASLGFAAMLFFMKVDYHYFRRFAWAGIATAIGLLLLVLVAGREVMGARRWIPIGPFGLQPTELTKIAMIFFIARLFADRPNRALSLTEGILPVVGVLGVIVLLIMKQPDFGSALVIIMTAVTMLFVAGMRMAYLYGLGLAGIPVLVWLAVSEPYRMARLLAFVDPWKDPQGKGYQTIQSLLALGSGGILGLGLGQSRQKFLYLPEQHTDFIFAILGEELGLIGTVSVITLFFVFAWRGYKIAIDAPDHFGSLLAAGITSMVVFQGVLNMGVISSLLPITGVTLPMISYGGSSLTISLAAIGILLNVSKHGVQH